jgi:hypothetical protein
MSNNRKSQSIRGQSVDFDLLRVKAAIETNDKPDSVEMREKYIDIRRRRNPRRNVSDLENEQRGNESDAREKIQKSREARLQREAEETTVDDILGDSSPTPIQEASSEPKRTSRKKIVRRSKTED